VAALRPLMKSRVQIDCTPTWWLRLAATRRYTTEQLAVLQTSAMAVAFTFFYGVVKATMSNEGLFCTIAVPQDCSLDVVEKKRLECIQKLEQLAVEMDREIARQRAEKLDQVVVHRQEVDAPSSELRFREWAGRSHLLAGGEKN